MSQRNSHPRALVVVVDPAQTVILRRLVERCGFEVQSLASVAATEAEVAAQLPSVVIAAFELPDRSGLELVQEFKARYPGLPTVLVPAAGSEELAVRALTAGAAGYVPIKRLDRDLPRVLERVMAVARKESQKPPQAADGWRESLTRYRVPTDPSLVAGLVGRIEAELDLMQLCDATGMMQISMALHEALTNALEHGNLELDSTLRESDEVAYRDLVHLRCQQEPYRSRSVRVTVRHRPRQVEFEITDEGPGFDPSLLPDPTDPANLERPSGRGLLLIRSFMDDVRHNATGNQITLVKRFDSPPES